jgi:hypothetical protein
MEANNTNNESSPYLELNNSNSNNNSNQINDLIEEFHWLPQDVAKIPYRKLQEFLIVRREKNNARNARNANDDPRVDQDPRDPLAPGLRRRF